MIHRNILRNRLSVRVEQPQQQEQPKYCITIFRGKKVTTLCGEDLGRLVEAADAVTGIDMITLSLPTGENNIKISKKIERRGLFEF